MEKKVYSWKTFKWGALLTYLVAPLALGLLIFTVASYALGDTGWESNAAELLEKNNMEVVEVEVEPGDTYWSIQRSVQPGAKMWDLHDAFIGLNPHYDGTTVHANETYKFVRYKN